MKTQTSQLKTKLENDARISFIKLDTLRYASYYDGGGETTELIRARTLGECVWNTAKEIGE